MNLFVAEPNPNLLTKMHFYTLGKGLKTGMYYLRTKAATDAIKFTVDKKALENAPDSTMAKSVEQKDAEIACSIDNPDDCEACGS